MNRNLAIIVAVMRTAIDLVYFIQIHRQLKPFHGAPESILEEDGRLGFMSKETGRNYLKTYFILDLFAALPLPLVIILLGILRSLQSLQGEYMNVLLYIILVQYVLRASRFLIYLHNLTRRTSINESALEYLWVNLALCCLVAHSVGLIWYFLGLQIVHQCLKEVCLHIHSPTSCRGFLYCIKLPIQDIPPMHYSDHSTRCLGKSSEIGKGIFQRVLPLVTESNVLERYTSSLTWGWQRLNAVGGREAPNNVVLENVFNICMTVLCALVTFLVITNIQTFVQLLQKSKQKMQEQRRDLETWMSQMQIPTQNRSQIMQALLLRWSTIGSLNEEELRVNLPHAIQRDVHEYYFRELENNKIFKLIDAPAKTAFHKKLKREFYAGGNYILKYGYRIEYVCFIVKGSVESIGKNGDKHHLFGGDICGEELLTWYLGKRVQDNHFEQCITSTRDLKCTSYVELFCLHVDDLEQIIKIFNRYLQKPHILWAIRYGSPYWRNMAAISIQVAWRYRERRLYRKSRHVASSGESSCCRAAFGLSEDATSRLPSPVGGGYVAKSLVVLSSANNESVTSLRGKLSEPPVADLSKKKKAVDSQELIEPKRKRVRMDMGDKGK